MPIFDPHPSNDVLNEALERCQLKFLKPSHIFMLDEALSSIGNYGEVRLVVNKGCLRFIVMEKSYDTYKWREGEGFQEST